ncbi:Glyceraldehyde-3-phosphate dehydrogenase [Yokenella regensburgei]|nr:Glyceraldehyde-3-phosphate dehydrogenase [Yokenella regensburgei]
MSKIGINGFGRIGRLVLRRLLEVKTPVEVVAINDLTSPKVLAYLLKHDSNYGPFPWSVDYTEDALIVNGKKNHGLRRKRREKYPVESRGGHVNCRMYRVLHLRRKSTGAPGCRGEESAYLCPCGRDENHRL